MTKILASELDLEKIQEELEAIALQYSRAFTVDFYRDRI